MKKYCLLVFGHDRLSPVGELGEYWDTYCLRDIVASLYLPTDSALVAADGKLDDSILTATVTRSHSGEHSNHWIQLVHTLLPSATISTLSQLHRDSSRIPLLPTSHYKLPTNQLSLLPSLTHLYLSLDRRYLSPPLLSPLSTCLKPCPPITVIM